MSKRRTQVVILCEDIQHATFLRRALYNHGWTYNGLTVKRSPKSFGDAKQYIYAEYPKEVRELRRKNWRYLCLFVVIDADTDTVQDRLRMLDRSLTNTHSAQEPRSRDEQIVILVPKRNIETWIHYLAGNDQETDEVTVYPKLKHESDCQPAVDRFCEICPNNLPDNALPSLKAGCDEFDRCPK